MAGPSQPQVTDEVWDDARIKSFLQYQPYRGGGSARGSAKEDSADFHTLVKAYRGMRPADFARFLSFFVEAGRDLDAKDAKGRTIWQIMASHRQGAEFIQLRNQLEK